jgi:hypothetical protein
MWRLGENVPPAGADDDPVLEHCRECARALVAALNDLKFARPEEIQGLL